MNNKITMPALVALLALKSGLTKEKSEEFLKEFFKLIAETLCSGEAVKIKALGTFKILEVEMRKSVNISNGDEIIIPGHKRIVFLPSKEIAEVINAPFSMFESVELHPDAVAEIEGADSPEPKAKAPETVAIEEKSATIIENPTTHEEIEDFPQEEPTAHEERGEIKKEAPAQEVSSLETAIREHPMEVSSDQPIESSGNSKGDNSEEKEVKNEELEDKTEEEVSPEPIEDSPEPIEDSPELIEGKKKRGGSKFAFGFITGIILALGIGAAIYFFYIRKAEGKVIEEDRLEAPIEDSLDSNEEEETVDSADESISFLENASSEVSEEEPEINEEKNEKKEVKEEAPATDPSDKPAEKGVKDVIGDRRYLTTMAQAHYGNYNLWPYIYEENKSFLGHPDRIKPGTEVVVPPLSKYGVDPNNPADIKKAKRMGVEIYKRYEKQR